MTSEDISTAGKTVPPEPKIRSRVGATEPTNVAPGRVQRTSDLVARNPGMRSTR